MHKPNFYVEWSMCGVCMHACYTNKKASSKKTLNKGENKLNPFYYQENYVYFVLQGTNSFKPNPGPHGYPISTSYQSLIQEPHIWSPYMITEYSLGHTHS
jgi:hypothetical protein